MIDYAPRLIGALLTLIIGRQAIKRVHRLISAQLQKSSVDKTVRKFLVSLLDIVLKIVLLIAVAGMFGIKTTSFVALLGAAGLAIGLSLQGSLSNFSGGVIILLFKPYQVGDLVEIYDEKGHVSDITVFNTTLVTLDNNNVIIPNGPIINDKIINYSKRSSMRIDVPVGISYQADIDQARNALLEMVRQHEIVLTDPSPQILVHELGDSSVNLRVRVHCHPDDHRQVHFLICEHAKKALDQAAIEIPFPQRVVHMQSNT